MNFNPPPPDAVLADTLDVVARDFAAHVAAEHRRSWSGAGQLLTMDALGFFGARGWPLVPFELGGLRALLVHFNDYFPRATPVLSRLSPAVLALVWGELYQGTGDVRVFERTGPAGTAVWAAAPVSYPAEVTVVDLVAGVAGLFLGEPPFALLKYDAAESAVDLLVDYGAFNVRVCGTDRYDAGGVSVAVETKDGAVLGDPLPGVKKRRREGGDTVVEGVAEKLRAAEKFFLSKRGA